MGPAWTGADGWKVSIGRDGWLFLRSDGKSRTCEATPWTGCTSDCGWISSTSGAQCRGRGSAGDRDCRTKSSMPRPMRVDEVAFERTRYGGLMSGRDAWSPELRQAMLDLHPIIEACCPEESYFKTDTHWNHHGAAAGSDPWLGSPVWASCRQRAHRLSMRETVDGGSRSLLRAASRFELSRITESRSRIRTIEDLQQLPPPPSLPKSPAPRAGRPRFLRHDSSRPLSAGLPGCVYEEERRRG